VDANICELQEDMRFGQDLIYSFQLPLKLTLILFPSEYSNKHKVLGVNKKGFFEKLDQ
jgi:hypothetical protein